MSEELKIALAQLNLTVGDIGNNTKRIIEAAQHARDELKADLIVFHELAISNYSPEDLLYHQDLYEIVERGLMRIAEETKGIDVVVGFPEATGDVNDPTTKTRFNSAAWLRDGAVHTTYRKQLLPNYAVFDEKRYFANGNASVIVELKGFKIAMLICEDIWHPEPIAQAKAAGAQLVVSPNGSPYSNIMHERRIKALRTRVSESGLPIVYVNQLGGHDELAFDGNSLVMNSGGEIACQLPFCEEKIDVVRFDQKLNPEKHELPELISKEAEIYQVLVMATRDYVRKNGFSSVLVGSSGGIDSALTIAIATDALGAENVEAILMPSQYTTNLSNSAALEQAKLLGIKHQSIAIEPIFKSMMESLTPAFENTEVDTTEENLQARIRGNLLMALSNKSGKMVLTTGNKSEMAVGYATIYGDMAGGFAMLKDVYKTLVYQLASYRNTVSPAIPQKIIAREPTAELAPNQRDQDTLPAYEELDGILKLYIEENHSLAKIVEAGFDTETVNKIVRMITSNEYKRRQAAPGPRITKKAFGRDWRYPITSKYIKHQLS